MTSVSKNVQIDKFDDIVNEYNSTYRTINMKTVDVKDNAYIDSGQEVNGNDPKLQVGDYVRISKYKKFLLKDILRIGLKKFL